MKKLLALVLALIMVLGLGVVAFADTTIPYAPKVIVLDKEDDEDEDLEEIEFLPTGVKTDTNEYKYLVGPDGGDFYVEIKTDGLKNITVSATGNVSAEIVEFDPEEMKYPESAGIHFYVVDDKEELNDSYNLACVGVVKAKAELGEGAFNTAVEGTTDYTYDWADAIAKALNKKYKSSRFSAVAFEQDKNNADNWVKLEKDLLKITVEENYTAAYKEGTVKLTATRKADKKDVVAELTIISDVSIFEFDHVNWAVEEGEYLYYKDGGYSDYFTAKLGYGDKYDADALREMYPIATVVSTTAFRAIEGEELTVAADDNNYVTIDEVAKGQKGVNFALEGFKFYDEDDEELFSGSVKDHKGNIIADNWKKVKGDVEYITFGFLGNQVINSDFTVYVAPKISYYELRELFGKKVEEEDILTYYVLKDGVKIDEFTVDYANDDIDEFVELEILGKAGDKLGFYTITLDAPAAEEGEENPNTGAESVVGVVAAMAVVSLVAAAAVSLKK